MQSTTLVGSLLSQIQNDSNSERLFALRALRELTCHDDRARRLVVSLPNGCDALVACCNGGMNALVTELSEAGTSAWETMVQLQAMYVSCFAWVTRSTQCLHIMPASKPNHINCTRMTRVRDHTVPSLRSSSLTSVLVLVLLLSMAPTMFDGALDNGALDPPCGPVCVRV